MSNLSELKTLLSGIGGTPLASDTNDETIGKIASLAPEKMLPTVSTSDSGKVLTVNSSGEWEPSSGGGGGGGGVLVVNGTMDVEEGTVTLDKTYGEMESALEECPFAVAVINTPSGKTIGTLAVWSPYTVDSYYYAFENMGTMLQFSGDNATDYPVAQLPDGGGN